MGVGVGVFGRSKGYPIWRAWLVLGVIRGCALLGALYLLPVLSTGVLLMVLEGWAGVMYEGMAERLLSCSLLCSVVHGFAGYSLML